MKNHLKNSFLILFFALFSCIVKAQTYTLKFKTNHGNFKVLLYDFTPNHRDLILSEIKKGTYKKANFNRVIKDFVIQGGELDEPILARESQYPNQKPLRLASEFHPKAFHKIGALGAGRDDNETKGSYFNQIYFVVGKRINEIELDLLEQKKNIKFTPQQRAEYLKNGGQPRLDQDYTVFGEIVEGLDNVIKISREITNQNDLPVEPIVFKIKIKKNLPKSSKRTSISAGVGFGHR